MEQLYMANCLFLPLSVTEPCLLWYGLKHLLTLHKLREHAGFMTTSNICSVQSKERIFKKSKLLWLQRKESEQSAFET